MKRPEQEVFFRGSSAHHPISSFCCWSKETWNGGCRWTSLSFSLHLAAEAGVVRRRYQAAEAEAETETETETDCERERDVLRQD